MDYFFIYTIDHNDADHVTSQRKVTQEEVDRLLRPIAEFLRDHGQYWDGDNKCYVVGARPGNFWPSHNWDCRYFAQPGGWRRRTIVEKYEEQIEQGLISAQLLEEFHENYIEYSFYCYGDEATDIHTIVEMSFVPVHCVEQVVKHR